MQGVQGGKQAPRWTSGAIAKMEIEILGTFEYLIRVKILGILLSLSEKGARFKVLLSIVQWELYVSLSLFLFVGQGSKPTSESFQDWHKILGILKSIWVL